jgi:hypothetical protein
LDHEERNPSISPHYGDKEMHQPPASAPQEGRGRNRKGSDNRATMSRENTVVDEYTTSITGQVAVSVSAGQFLLYPFNPLYMIITQMC